MKASMETDTDEIYEAEMCVRRLLEFLREDPYREGLRDTPKRVIQSFQELYSGYTIDIPALFTTFESDTTDEMIVLKDIEFYSTCEHHMQPFFGKAHIAYIPDKRIVGISKLARLLEAFARRLQIQERITQQVTHSLDQHLQPLGSACVLESSHFCMVCRGVQKQHSKMITSSLTGVFRQQEVRNEFLGFIR